MSISYTISTYDIVYDIVRQTYDIVRQTYDIVYDVDKTYDIVGFYPIVANLTYDIVYDIVRQRTMSYTIYVCYVGIIRYRTCTSGLYDIVRLYLLKQTTCRTTSHAIS